MSDFHREDNPTTTFHIFIILFSLEFHIEASTSDQSNQSGLPFIDARYIMPEMSLYGCFESLVIMEAF
jgi:hypothetical protein